MANCPEGTTPQVVKCGKPTKAPYKGEKTPGTCSRTKTYCVPPAPPEWACYQHRGDYLIARHPREFKNCADAVQTFKDEKDKSEKQGDTNFALRHEPTSALTQVNGVWVGTASLKWTSDSEETIVNLPIITWPNMTADDHAAVQAALDALLAHEEGHVSRTKAYANSLAGNPKDKFKVSDPDPKVAKAALKDAVDKRVAEVVAAHLALQKQYDADTGSGEHQSWIEGGVDAVLRCPPAAA